MPQREINIRISYQEASEILAALAGLGGSLAMWNGLPAATALGFIGGERLTRRMMQGEREAPEMKPPRRINLGANLTLHSGDRWMTMDWKFELGNEWEDNERQTPDMTSARE